MNRIKKIDIFGNIKKVDGHICDINETIATNGLRTGASCFEVF